MIKKIFLVVFLVGYLFSSDYHDAITLYKQNKFQEASKLFLKAAQAGDAESAYILGYLYTGGIGVKPDLKESVKWYKIAAKKGHTNAQVNLGWAYIGGQGVKVDYKKAAFWVKKAKDKGSVQAKRLWNEFKLNSFE